MVVESIHRFRCKVNRIKKTGEEDPSAKEWPLIYWQIMG
jgi:hypothetical protein